MGYFAIVLFAQPFFILIFLPLFFAAYYTAHLRHKNAVALMGSLLFYAWGAPKFVLVLVATGLLDYLISTRWSQHRLATTIGVVYNLALLVVFKYFGFFLENVRVLLDSFGIGHSLGVLEIGLPLGLSFFTFQKISYLLDVYRGEAKPAKNAVAYLLFISLFPQLIAGPILRFKDLADQLAARTCQANWSQRWDGFQRVALGLAKKVLIADNLAPVANAFFDGNDSGVWAWLGLVAYALQIYFDFSGYCDMAIGMGRMMDFSFPENFNWPYKSRSVREFWQRWHMTLSTWMRDYLYVPLGGNRKGAKRTMINLSTVFLLSGLWHGAQWTFVIWGAWHGAFIAAERWWPDGWKIKSLGWLYSIIAVVLGWLWFRSADVSAAMDAIYRLTHWEAQLSSNTWNLKLLFIAAVAVGFSLFPRRLHASTLLRCTSQSMPETIVKSILGLLLLALSLAQLAIAGAEPFIYFRF